MSRRLATVLALCVAFARVGSAQDYQLDPMSRLDARYRIPVESLIDSARQAGLPWAAVRSKALEGINKKFDGARVLSVVRQYFNNLETARDVLGPVSSQDVESGASVLIAGVRPEELALFRPTTNGRSPTRALVYLADLISARRGVPREDAVSAFAKLWKDGAADSDFDGLWRDIDKDILNGVSPKAALQNRMRSIRPPAEQEIPHL